MRYSVQPRDRIFVKGYGFLSFNKDIGKNNGKNISKILSGKYSHKLFDHAKKCATDRQLFHRQLQMKMIKKDLKIYIYIYIFPEENFLSRNYWWTEIKNV